MAEAIVSIAIDKIANLLAGEVNLLSAVKEDVERLQAELKRMRSFLKDADREKDHDERLRNWVAEIRELAYDADDVIDAFLFDVSRREVELCGFRPSMLFKAPQLHTIGDQIKSIRTRIGDLSTSIHTYGYNMKFGGEAEGSGTSTSEMQRRLRRTDPDNEDEDIISLETTTKAVMEQLMNKEDQLRVVSIVGMGGLGKTTLAKKVYNHYRTNVKKHFDCYSWVFISQQFSPRDAYFGILLEVSPGEDRRQLKSMSEEELVKRLNNALKDKRYLVVLDDIWKEEAWDSLKQAFPKGKKGSKVLCTTRIKDVALHADPRSYPVEPPFLTDEQGWQLLRKKAFLDNSDENNQHYMPEFEKLGVEMVRKCGGLPLAIAVLGGLLCNKSLKEWEVMQADINAQLIKLQKWSQYSGVNWILALSYQDLPYRLKPCFLYLSQFPEDWEIRKGELIRMWIAEGFIPQEEGDETLEDVGQGYLEELVSRSMLQVSKRNHTGTGIKTCRMHDLMRDMCLLKAREEEFLGVIEPNLNNTCSRASLVLPSMRRIAVHCGKQNSPVIPAKEFNPRLHSLLYFTSGFKYEQMAEHELIFILKNFRFLRVLNLDVTCWICVPRDIGNLIHLRHLGLKTATRRRSYRCLEPFGIAESLGQLKSLYTLHLGGFMQKVADVLWKLESLRHLFFHKNYVGKGLRMDTLRNLRTLKWARGKDLIKNGVLHDMTNLRVLTVKLEKTEEAEAIFGLDHLHSLKIVMESSKPFPNFEQLSNFQCLTKLELKGVIMEDPQSPHQNLKFLPESLTKLTLIRSKLYQDPCFVLGKLPNLKSLSLKHDAYLGYEMDFGFANFHLLESLQLIDLSNLMRWSAQSQWPCLKILNLTALDRLRWGPYYERAFPYASIVRAGGEGGVEVTSHSWLMFRARQDSPPSETME